MEGRRYTAGTPASFDMYRVYSPLVAAAARAAGKSPRRHEAGDTYDTEPVDDHTVRTSRIPLQPPGFMATHRWCFTDGEHWSAVIRSVRGIDLRVKLHAATPPGFPVDGGVEVEATLAPGLGDPTVDLSLVLPWETGSPHGMTVSDVLRDELTFGDDVDEALLADTLAFAQDFLPETPLPGWELFIQPDVLELEPGPADSPGWWPAPSARTALWIRAEGPGRLALAVHAAVRDGAGEDAVSSVVAIERAEDHTIAVLYDDAIW